MILIKIKLNINPILYSINVQRDEAEFDPSHPVSAVSRPDEVA